MALSANEWAAQIAKQVGQAVAHYRAHARDPSGKRVTAQTLADRCAGLGLPLDRTVIAKLEKGTRQTITVGELLVLARALEIPPVLLLFPLGREETTEVLPGQDADTWKALKWFTGEDSRLSSADLAHQDTQPVELYRKHDELLHDWWTERRTLGTIASTRGAYSEFRSETDPTSADDLLMERAMEKMRDIQMVIYGVRDQIRGLGLTPPELGPAAPFFDAGTLDAAVQTEIALGSIPTETLPQRPQDSKGDS